MKEAVFETKNAHGKVVLVATCHGVRSLDIFHDSKSAYTGKWGDRQGRWSLHIASVAGGNVVVKVYQRNSKTGRTKYVGERIMTRRKLARTLKYGVSKNETR